MMTQDTANAVKLFEPHFKDSARGLDYYLSEMKGYQAAKKAFGMSQDDVIGEVKKSNMRGRGGAGFPTGVKPRHHALHAAFVD